MTIPTEKKAVALPRAKLGRHREGLQVDKITSLLEGAECRKGKGHLKVI